MSFILQLLKGFIRSGVNQVGRDGGKVISNKVYGDKHNTPLKILTEEETNQKDLLITDICELLKMDKETFLYGISSGNFKFNISLLFTDNKVNGKETFKTKCTNLYDLLLDETQKFNLNHFYTQILKVFEREEKKISLESKFKDVLNEDNLSLLLDGKYFLDMTEEMVKESFGEPNKIEEEVLKTKTKKTYIYGNRSSGDILVFENGKLVKFKDR